MRKGKYEQWEKDLIKEMRNNNKGYTEIARRLDRKKDSIKGFCRANNLGGFRKLDTNPENAYDNFIKNFNKTYGDRYLYIDGYTHSDNDVIIECKSCHTQMSRNAGTIRHNKPLFCEGCIQTDKDKQSLIDILGRRIKVLTREIELKAKEEQREKDLITVCEECGKTFKGLRLGMKYCSDVCYRRMSNRNREKTRMYKIINNGKIDKDITLTKLIKRDKGICHICNGRCSRKDYAKTEEGHFIVGESYPSIDHIVPVSKGGTHTWDNIKLAHHYCNTIKRDKEIYEEGTGQFKLIM